MYRNFICIYFAFENKIAQIFTTTLIAKLVQKYSKSERFKWVFIVRTWDIYFEGKAWREKKGVMGCPLKKKS